MFIKPDYDIYNDDDFSGYDCIIVDNNEIYNKIYNITYKLKFIDKIIDKRTIGVWKIKTLKNDKTK